MSSVEEEEEEYGIRQKISTLFFADDSLAMTKTMEATKKT